MSIELKTKLGNVALKINATLRNDKQDEVSKAALAHLVFHAAPSKIENFKKNREEVYSEELAGKVKKGLEGVLEACFKDIKIETSMYVKQESKGQRELQAAHGELQAAHNAMKAIGTDEKTLRAAFPKLYEKTATEVVENDEESVG